MISHKKMNKYKNNYLCINSYITLCKFQINRICNNLCVIFILKLIYYLSDLLLPLKNLQLLLPTTHHQSS